MIRPSAENPYTQRTFLGDEVVELGQVLFSVLHAVRNSRAASANQASPVPVHNIADPPDPPERHRSISPVWAICALVVALGHTRGNNRI